MLAFTVPSRVLQKLPLPDLQGYTCAHGFQAGKRKNPSLSTKIHGENYTEEATPAATMFVMERRGKIIAFFAGLGVVVVGGEFRRMSRASDE